MNILVKHVAIASLCMGMLATTTAQAHGIWFAQRSTQLALIYGVGADDLDAVKRQPLISGINGYDAAGQPVATTLRATENLLLVDSEGQPAVVAALLDNGNWSKTPEGKWHKKGKDEVPNAIVSEHTYKYAVHLRSPLSAPLAPLPGHTLQIVPVKTALPLLAGEPIKLRVLYKGKPVAGAEVYWDYVNDPDGKTVKSAADGTVTIKVRNQGLNVVVAVLKTPPGEPNKVNLDEHLASLSFVLAHKPE
jgi:nickel transport protein